MAVTVGECKPHRYNGGGHTFAIHNLGQVIFGVPRDPGLHTQGVFRSSVFKRAGNYAHSKCAIWIDILNMCFEWK